jgi:hypothetical protein
MKYRWEIRTGDGWYAGTDAGVFLSLSGDKASMKEMQLSDPDTNNDWEKGDVNHGGFETADLGNLTTGTLRQDGGGAGPDWEVDYCRVTNDEDGRSWLAGVNSELKGNQPKRLVFSLTDRGNYDQMQAQKKAEADKRALDAADAQAASEEAEEDRLAAEEDKKFQKELQNQKKQLQRELQRAKMEAELAKLRGQIPGASTPATGGTTTAMRTVELYGMLNGATVPLTQAVRVGSGSVSIVPGARVMRGDGPGDGFGLGGTPGRWSSFYSESPSNHGLPPNIGVIGSDGSRGYVLNSQFLQLLFGGGWMSAIS